MKSTVFIAVLFAATTASAQSSLFLPNNSAGTEMDTPPLLPADPKILEPTAPRSEAPRAIDERKARELEWPAIKGQIREARPEPDEPEALKAPPAEPK
jgi:hypothetical protein